MRYNLIILIIFIVILQSIVSYYNNFYQNKKMILSIIKNIGKSNNKYIYNKSKNLLLLSSYLHDYTENQKKFLFGDNIIKFRDIVI